MIVGSINKFISLFEAAQKGLWAKDVPNDSADRIELVSLARKEIRAVLNEFGPQRNMVRALLHMVVESKALESNYLGRVMEAAEEFMEINLGWVVAAMTHRASPEAREKAAWGPRLYLPLLDLIARAGLLGPTGSKRVRAAQMSFVDPR